MIQIQIDKIQLVTNFRLGEAIMASVDPKKAASIYEFSAKDIDGNEVSLARINIVMIIHSQGEPREVQGSCVCDRERGHQVRKDRRELQVGEAMSSSTKQVYADRAFLWFTRVICTPVVVKHFSISL